jgi:hypothetical protein
MADTQRSLAELTGTLFSDGQAIASITPQDIRDLIVSLTPSYGGLFFTSPVATSVATPGTYVKASGTTTSTNLRNFTMPVSNRLTYTGAASRHFHLVCSVSMTTSGTNNDISIGIAKNGAVVEHTKITRFIATGSDRGAFSTHGDIILTTNDYIELWLTDEDSAENVTIFNAYLFAMGMVV